MPDEKAPLKNDEGYVAVEGKDEENQAAGSAKPSLKSSKTVDKNGFERAQLFVANLQDTEANSCWKQALACFLKYLMKPLIVVIMIYIWIFKQLYKVYKMLPMNIVYMIFGVALCFMGGMYFASIAAFEAFRSFGGQALVEELTIVWEEAKLANAASEADDQVDADNNGVKDVQEMSANELISHKAKVALAAVEDPTRLTKAMQFLFSSWLSVIATLKMQFAQTVALCLGVSSMLEYPATMIFGPILAMVMGKDLQKWVPAAISTTIKIVAVCVASFVQSIISAFYSGLRGGRIFAEAFISMMGEAGILDKMPDCITGPKPFDANQSYLDEVIGLPLAAWGFYYQLSNGMSAPYPWNIPLFPLTCIEWIIRWNIFT